MQSHQIVAQIILIKYMTPVRAVKRGLELSTFGVSRQCHLLFGLKYCTHICHKERFAHMHSKSDCDI